MWLGIDTTTERLGLALVNPDDGTSYPVTDMVYRDMAMRLHPELKKLMAQAKVTPSQLTGIAVTRGPGSYTGMRLGLAAAQGLALVAGTPLVGVNAQAVIARPHLGQGRSVCVVSRANAGDVYLAVVDTTGTPTQQTDLVPIADMVAHIPPHALVVGTAAALLEGNIPNGVDVLLDEESAYPNPVQLIHTARALHAEGADAPASPLYLHALTYRKSPGLKT